MTEPEISEARRIGRAAVTLQAVFLQFREATWHRHVQSINSKPGMLGMVIDPDFKNRFNGWFSPFPNEMVHNARDKAAVLTAMACYDLAHMKELVEQLFADMDVLIEEVMIRPKRPLRQVVMIYEGKKVDFNTYDHWILRITSHTSGKQWAIHVAGAQYDIMAASYNWDYMKKQYIDKVIKVQPFGALEAYATAMTSGKSAKSGVGLRIGVQAGAMLTFHAIVDMQMDRKSLTWTNILGKKEVDYLRHRDKVLKVGMKAMEEYVSCEFLAKRRVKAQRYDHRHYEELLVEETEIVKETLGLEGMALPSEIHVGEVMVKAYQAGMAGMAGMI